MSLKHEGVSQLFRVHKNRGQGDCGWVGMSQGRRLLITLITLISLNNPDNVNLSGLTRHEVKVP